jgi:hypothetical protein
MTIYRVRLLGPRGEVAAAQQFTAASLREAVAIARGMAKEDSWFMGFDLWNARRKVHVETRSTTLKFATS